MLRNVFAKTLRDQRRALVWWSAGLLATALLMSAFYPTIRDSADQLRQYVNNMPEAMKSLFGGFRDYTSPAGYLKAELFNFMLPVVFLVFAVGAGGRAIAGEEERRTLDLLLANPVSRRRVVVEKAAAIVASTTFLAAVMWAGLAIGAPAFGIRVSLARLAAQTSSMVLLSLAFGVLALAVGCLRGNRGLASAVAGAVAVAAYLVNALAPTVEWLEPYRRVSPFFYYNGHDPIVNGLSPAHVGVLVSICLVLGAIAIATFDRRDLAA